MKKLFRDFYPSLLFVIGFSLTFCTAISEMLLMDAWFREQTVVGKSAYQYEITWNIEKSREQLEAEAEAIYGIPGGVEQEQEQYEAMAEELIQRMKEGNANAMIRNLYLPIGDGLTPEPVNVVFSYHEPLNRTLTYGSYPDSLESVSRGVYVGSFASYHVREKDGDRQIRFGGELTKVEGEYESTEGKDASVYVFYDCLGESGKRMVLQRVGWNLSEGFPLYVSFGSDLASVEEQSGQFCQECQKMGLPVEADSGDAGMEVTEGLLKFLKKAKSVIHQITLAVSLVNCFLITMLWITRRKQELLVCKAFGMGSAMLLGRVMKDVAGLLLVSFGFSAVFMAGFALVSGQAVTVSGENAAGILVIVAALLGALTAAMLPAAVVVWSLNPARGLKEL